MKGILRVLIKIITVPLGIFFRIIFWSMIVAMGALVLYLPCAILIGFFDLIFRTKFGQHIQETALEIYEKKLLPVALPLWGVFVKWCDDNGVTAFFVRVGDTTSDFALETLRFFLLLIIFLALGFGFYHLRVFRRLVYAGIEFFVAVVAMLVAINAMAGGDFAIGYIIALTSGLYVMVRGLQNTDDGLRELQKYEADNQVPNGYGAPAYEIWQAIFYDRYTAPGLSERRDRVLNAASRIIAIRKERAQAGSSAELASATPLLTVAPPAEVLPPEPEQKEGSG